MSSLFDGVAAALSEVFGAAVTYSPAAGLPRPVQSILRRSPVTAIGPDGSDVLVVRPTWRVRRDLVPEIARGDLVADAEGSLRILNVWPQGSPAADAHLVCELEALAS